MLFDSRGEEGRGLFVQLTDKGTVSLHMVSYAYDPPGSREGNGMVASACTCDRCLLTVGRLHQILFIVDGGPKLMSVMIDGVLCDGGDERQYGWSRFHPNFMSPNGAPQAILAPFLNGELRRMRLYDRYLLTSEGVANWRAGCEQANA